MEASINFLRRFEPEGHWVLTAIRPDRKAIETRTFHHENLDALRAWLTEHNGSWNIYFHVNRALRDLNKKAERDFNRVRFFFFYLFSTR